MANEFIVRKGLIVTGSTYASGSVTSSLGFSGDGSKLTGVVSSSYAVTSSYTSLAQNVLGSISSASYALVAQSVLGSISSASYADTASYLQALKLGIGLNTTTFDPTNPETLRISSSNASSINVVSIYANLNNYIQSNIRNTSAGSTGSSDMVATNDTGDEIGNYIDMGINSSGYAITNGVGVANSPYLYATSSNGEFYIGNASPGAAGNIRFFAGAYDAATATKMFISSSATPSVGIGTLTPRATLHVQGNVSASSVTASLQGSASFAPTSSFVNNSLATLNVIIVQTGSLLTTGYKSSVNIPSNCFIEKIRMHSRNSGSIAFDVRTNTYAAWAPDTTNGTTITGSTLLSMSSAVKYEDTALTGWSRNLTADNILNFIVSAVSGTTSFDTINVSLFLRKV